MPSAGLLKCIYVVYVGGWVACHHHHQAVYVVISLDGRNPVVLGRSLNRQLVNVKRCLDGLLTIIVLYTVCFKFRNVNTCWKINSGISMMIRPGLCLMTADLDPAALTAGANSCAGSKSSSECYRGSGAASAVFSIYIIRTWDVQGQNLLVWTCFESHLITHVRRNHIAYVVPKWKQIFDFHHMTCGHVLLTFDNRSAIIVLSFFSML